VNEVKDLLDSLAPGKLADTAVLERLLAAGWDDFTGSDGGMEGYKLLGRMEKVHWQPPILSFDIERHGGTVCGSTRAELQHWEVNVETMTAEIKNTGRRQLEPMAQGVDVNAIKAEIVRKILAGEEDPRLRWIEPGVVHVVLSRIFPDRSGYKRTVEGRRERLRDGLRAALGLHRWVHQGRNVFHLFIPSLSPRRLNTCCPKSDCTSFRDCLRFLHSFGVEPDIQVDERGHYFEYTIPATWTIDERRCFHTAVAQKVESEQPPCSNCADVMYSRAWVVQCKYCKEEFVLCEECILTPVELCRCTEENGDVE
jgi:hypothetical protein